MLVEPKIANVIWHSFSEEQAEAVRKERGEQFTIMDFWTPETSCKARHLGSEHFGNLFDWPAL